MKRCTNLILILALTLAITAGCSSSTPDRSSDSGSIPAGRSGPVSANKDDYPVFPDADAGADPSVASDQGGKGFTGEGWETNRNFDFIGDPQAVKGGVFREGMPDFPATLRYIGPNLSVWNAMLSGMVYESLLGMHPITLEYMPALATHWQVSPDKLTYRFRIDSNSRWNDGQPVTAEDVVATWKLNVDKSVQDPFRNAIYGKFEQPVAESKYIVRVKAKDASWQNLYQFSGMAIYPAHVLKNIDGATFIREYNDKMLPGSGPYMVKTEDVEKGKAVHIRRRPDYWAEKYRRNVGLNNFDEIREVVVRDRNLEFEMLKKGDLDYYFVNRAQMWVQELNFDKIQSGVLQKRKIFNHAPESLNGIAFNTRRKPFDDIRVRKALRHLFNRELMIEKLIFNEYLPQNSHYPGSVYENPNNEKIKYDPQKGLQLLAEAGWKERDSSGRLLRNGAPLTLEVLYYDRASEKYFTIFQEDLRKVGINLNLRYVTPETAFKLIDDQQFDMISVSYGGGGPFPEPEQFYDSKQADLKGSTNLTGFKNKRVDEIIAAYNKEFDVQKRIQLLRELDGIASNEHHWILEWYAPYTRFVYWNKFGQPKGYITRIGDYRDPPSLWWIDPQKAQRLDQALRGPSIKMEAGPSEDRYWLDFAKIEEHKNDGSSPQSKTE